MAKKPTEDSVQRVISQKTLVGLVRETELKRKRIQSEVGAIGERVADAVQRHNLHRGAFTLVCKLAGMDELKREDFLRQLGVYVDHCRAGGMFGPEHAGDLLDKNETEADEDVQKDAAPPPEWPDAKPLSMVGRGRGKPKAASPKAVN